MAKSLVVLRRFVVDLQDQWLFFVLAMAGAVSILSMKSLGAHQFVVTMFPVSLIIGYAVFALVTKRYRIREDKVGDNCYYLGFIFTLVSLSYALWVYDPSGAGVELIVTNFGIALATTIVGLILRIFFNQMREDPQEVEREVRYALADAARDLRSELNDITTQMEDFKRRIVQIVEEGIVDIHQRSSEALQKNVDTFNTSTRQVIEAVDNTLRGYEGSGRRMNEVAEMTVTAVTQLARRVEAVNISPEMVSGKLDPVIQQLAEIVDNVAKREASNTKALQALKKNLDGAVSSAADLQTALASGASGVKQNIEDMVGGLNAITQGAAQSMEVNKRLTSEMSAAVTAFRGEVERLGKDIGADVAKVTAQTNGLLETMKLQHKTLAEHAAETRNLADEGRDAVAEVQQSLISLTRAVTESVRG